MQSATTTKTAQAFELKGSLFTLTVFRLQQIDIDAIETQLTTMLKRTPNFFRHMPLVLDVSHIKSANILAEFNALLQLLHNNNMIPVGIRGADEITQELAANAGLAIFPISKSEPQSPAQTTKSKQANTVSNAAKLITQPVRSGQQIYARGTDLIVMASVSHGAELLADGNIHVYGTLRGRALAGVHGDKNARIFCKKLDSELIAIAGHYQIKENLHTEDYPQPVQIYLDDDHIRIENI